MLFFSCSDRIFLLPCNLRPVKDPLFLVDEFERWRNVEKNTDVHLLLIGPTLDPTYTQEVLLKVHVLFICLFGFLFFCIFYYVHLRASHI